MLLIVIRSHNFSKNFLFALIAKLIFTRSLRKATFPFLFIWNLVFKIGFGTLSQKHLRNVARGSRPVARAPQNRCVPCVPFRYLVFSTHLFVIYHGLITMCTSCTMCTKFFKLFETFFKNAVLFCKTNFNSNLPSTHGTHCFNPHGY